MNFLKIIKENASWKVVKFILISIILFGIIYFLDGITVLVFPLVLIGLIIFGVILFNKQKNPIFKKLESYYRFVKKYVKVIFHFFLAIILIFILTMLSKKVFSEDYYLVIDDLPKIYIDQGYTKQILQQQLESRINLVNSSDNKKSLLNVVNDNSEIRFEALGNSVYINNFIFYLRDLFGKRKFINIRFGFDQKEELFFNTKIINQNGSFDIFSDGIQVDNSYFNEYDMDQLIEELSIKVFLKTHPRKVISYYRFNISELDNIYYNHVQSGNNLSLNNIAYFYRIYGNSFFDLSNYSEADIKYRHALNIYENNNIEKDKEYFKLVESYCLNLHRMGRALFANNYLDRVKSKNKTLIAVQAYLLNDLGEIDKAKRLYEHALKRSYFNKDSIYGNYEFFTDSYATKSLLNIYIQLNEYEKAKEIAKKGFDLYRDNYFIYQLREISYMIDDAENAEALNDFLYSSNIDYHSYANWLNAENTFKYNIFEIQEQDKEESNNFSKEYFFYGENNHDFLQRVYPNSRLLTREIINNSKDSFLVEKAYSDYNKINPNDFQIKKDYLGYLVKIKDVDLVEKLAEDILNDCITRNKFDEDVYVIKKRHELSKLYELKAINTDSLFSSFYSDSIYTKIKNQRSKIILAWYSFLKDDKLNYDYYGYFNYLDSISNVKPMYSDFSNGISSIISNALIVKQIKQKSEYINIDSLIIESIRKRYNNEETWTLWGIMEDIKGRHESAELKYKKASQIDNQFNSFLHSANFLNNYGDNNAITAKNYEKAILFDTLAVNQEMVENFTKNYTLAYFDNKISKKVYDEYYELNNKYQEKYPLSKCFYQEIFLREVNQIFLDPQFVERNGDTFNKEVEMRKIYFLLKNAIHYGYNINSIKFKIDVEKYPSLISKINQLKKESSESDYKKVCSRIQFLRNTIIDF